MSENKASWEFSNVSKKLTVSVRTFLFRGASRREEEGGCLLSIPGCLMILYIFIMVKSGFCGGVGSEEEYLVFLLSVAVHFTSRPTRFQGGQSIVCRRTQGDHPLLAWPIAVSISRLLSHRGHIWGPTSRPGVFSFLFWCLNVHSFHSTTSQIEGGVSFDWTLQHCPPDWSFHGRLLLSYDTCVLKTTYSTV